MSKWQYDSLEGASLGGGFGGYIPRNWRWFYPWCWGKKRYKASISSYDDRKL